MITSWNLFLEKVGNIPLSNVDTYISGMNKSMNDKLFFVDKIKPDVIVDFGCADGTTLLNIKEKYPTIDLIGYDLDPDMVAQAKSKVKAEVTNNWGMVKSLLTKSEYQYPALLLSSVIHEVYSYSNSNTIKKFWEEQVFGGLFKYIVIRDMIPSTVLQKEDFLKFKEDAKKVNKKADKKRLFEFEKIWGLIDNDYRTFLHWLLKYTYTDNWEREVRENYLPLTIETLYKKIPSNYRVRFRDNFIFDPIQKRVMQDFGVKILHNTHTKMIIEKLD